MIALDLDNTIICYDKAFQMAAASLGCLPKTGQPVNKVSVKAAALSAGGNLLWTKLQGIAYSEGLLEAEPFPGSRTFINTALERKEKIIILSHKTEFPAIGKKINLRQAALNWLVQHRLFPGDCLPVKFFDSREEKVHALRALGCRFLLDDLPEVFHTPGFNPSTRFVLFDPNNQFPHWLDSPRVTSWKEASEILLPPRD